MLKVRAIRFVISLALLVVLASNVAAANPAAAGDKLSFRLAALAQSAALRSAGSVDQAQALSLPAAGRGSLMRDAAGQLLVDVRLSDLSAAQLQALAGAGARVIHTADSFRMVTAFVPVGSLAAVAALPAVENIQEELTPASGSLGASAPQARTSSPSAPVSCLNPQGAAVSEGDIQLKANLARSTYSLDGSGVKVGILSDSYDQSVFTSIHASDDVTSGDLPGTTNPCGYLTPVGVLAASQASGNTDEGRGMLQIVHDLAPAATLNFASAFNGLFSFADNIRALRTTAGDDVIADDVFYFAEPFFQEGPVNVAIRDVVSSGGLYFTLAGNNNLIVAGKNVSSYEAPAFRPATCPTAAGKTWVGKCHDFDPTAATNTGSGVTVPAGGEITIDFQWAEPWFGVTDNLDLYLLDSTNHIIASSANVNPGASGTQTPFEFIDYLNSSGTPQPVRIVINRKSGTGVPRLKYLFIQGTDTPVSIQYDTSAGGDLIGPTLYGHSANTAGLSVGAVPYNDATNPETYTSRGPAAFYFGPVVNSLPAAAIVPVSVTGPAFGATDGGCTTFFGEFRNGCLRFFGTSAAAPHAAAVAALLKQQANGLHVPFTEGVADLVLRNSAQPVLGGGLSSTGAGLIDANGAGGKLTTLKQVYLAFIQR